MIIRDKRGGGVRACMSTFAKSNEKFMVRLVSSGWNEIFEQGGW